MRDMEPGVKRPPHQASPSLSNNEYNLEQNFKEEGSIDSLRLQNIWGVSNSNYIDVFTNLLNFAPIHLWLDLIEECDKIADSYLLDTRDFNSNKLKAPASRA